MCPIYSMPSSGKMGLWTSHEGNEPSSLPKYTILFKAKSCRPRHILISVMERNILWCSVVIDGLMPSFLDNLCLVGFSHECMRVWSQLPQPSCPAVILLNFQATGNVSPLENRSSLSYRCAFKKTRRSAGMNSCLSFITVSESVSLPNVSQVSKMFFIACPNWKVP